MKIFLIHTLVLFFVFLFCLASGCVSPFYKEVSGSSLAVGITLPEAEILKIEALNWLNGEKILLYEPALILHTTQQSVTNSYFGIIKVNEHHNASTFICPTNNINMLTK